MLTLIVLLALGLVLGVFAVQNNSPITLHYGGYVLNGLPLYMVVIVSMLLGIAISWILSMFGAASTAMQLSGKDRAIRKYSDHNQALETRIHDLELENERLRGDVKEERVVAEREHEEVPHERPIDRMVNRVRNAFS